MSWVASVAVVRLSLEAVRAGSHVFMCIDYVKYTSDICQVVVYIEEWKPLRNPHDCYHKQNALVSWVGPCLAGSSEHVVSILFFQIPQTAVASHSRCSLLPQVLKQNTFVFCGHPHCETFGDLTLCIADMILYSFEFVASVVFGLVVIMLVQSM